MAQGRRGQGSLLPFLLPTPLSGGGAPDELAGLCWWQGHPVVVSLDGREVDASDPTLAPGILEDLLQSDDRRARVAAAANPNLPSDTLAGLLKPVFDSHDTYLERREEHVAAWQNPSTPVVMLLQPRDDYPEAARHVLLWLEHLHGVRLGSAHESLESRVESWTLRLQAPPGRRHEHRIVRDFASHLGDLFRLTPPPRKTCSSTGEPSRRAPAAVLRAGSRRCRRP